MKIAHISDLHLDSVYKKDNYKKTVNLFSQLYENNIDHLAITGDITENAEKESFIAFRNLLKRYGWFDSSKTSLVIGNHDIFGGVYLAEDVVNFPKKCKTTDYEKRAKDFGEFYKETFDKTVRPLKNKLFPYLKEFDDFVIIGINSIAKYSVIKNPFASNGEIADDELAAVEKLLSNPVYDNKQKIVLIHHHFTKSSADGSNSSSIWQKVERQTMKLYGKKAILKLFKSYGVSAVLHGHQHETNEYERKDIKILNAGGTILSSNSNDFHLHILEVNKNSISANKLTLNHTEEKPFHSPALINPYITIDTEFFLRKLSVN